MLPQLRLHTRIHLGNGQLAQSLDRSATGRPLAAMLPALFSHWRRSNRLCKGNAWDLGPHCRLSVAAAAATDELTIQLALQNAQLPSNVVDARGVGVSMAPFSSTSFSDECIAVLPVDPFSPLI
jgi:hypothetical protein